MTATMQGDDSLVAVKGTPFRRAEGGNGFAFDSLAPGAYTLLARIGGHTTRIAPVEVRAGELWELFYVPSQAR